MKICLACGYRHDREDWLCPACHNSPTQYGTILSFAPEISSRNIEFRTEYYHELVKVEGKHFWFQARNRLLIWALQTYHPRARSLLEIGCGTGFVLRAFRSAFPKMKLAGSEVLFDGLMLALERVSDASFFQMDARRVPFEDEFDIVGAFDVLEHIEEDEVVLKEMYRAVKPGGGILITVPQHQWLWSENDRVSGHRRRYARADLCQKVQSAGFRAVNVTSFISLLLPLLVWARRVKKIKGADDWSEFKIGSLANRVLKSILALEHWFIRAGVSFPVGGSLLLVARKSQ